MRKRSRDGRTLWSRGMVFPALVAASWGAACGGGGPVALPSPRPLVVYSGARLMADSAHLQEVHAWVTRAVDVIVEDPTFLLEEDDVPEEAYPWETIEFRGDDTVRIAYEPRAFEARTSYMVYAFLHLMDRTDWMDEWFEEAVGLEGYTLERFILDRTADSWLLGRAIFDSPPYPAMDELVYAQDRGFLDEFLLTARGDDFPEAKEDYERENPDGLGAYRTWFLETFDREPPGLRSR